MIARQPLRARSVRVDGGRVLVAEIGSGPPLVLIHGLGGTFRYWLESARHLAEHYRVLIPDVPGFGGSDPAARPFSMPAAGARLLAASEQLGVTRPVLVGHSLGGPIAALAAAQAPDRVGGVVLVSTTGLSPQRAWRRHVLLPIMRCALRNPNPWENLLGAHAWARGIVFTEMLARPRELDPFTTRMLVGGASLARQLADSLEASLACDLRETLRELPAPLGVVWGEHDETVSIADAELAQRLRPDARARIVPAAGHLPMIEFPAAFAVALRDVLPDGWRDDASRVGSFR
jgi:pimeloyl-ACP methyl ester carboxylesterase